MYNEFVAKQNGIVETRIEPLSKPPMLTYVCIYGYINIVHTYIHVYMLILRLPISDLYDVKTNESNESTMCVCVYMCESAVGDRKQHKSIEKNLRLCSYFFGVYAFIFLFVCSTGQYCGMKIIANLCRAWQQSVQQTYRV